MNNNWDYYTSVLTVLASDARTAAEGASKLPGGATNAMLKALTNVSDSIESMLDEIGESNANGQMDSEDESGDDAGWVRQKPSKGDPQLRRSYAHKPQGCNAAKAAHAASSRAAAAFSRGRSAKRRIRKR